jgi:hypothetical protein
VNDVLQDHRKRNRAPKSPKPDKLRSKSNSAAPPEYISSSSEEPLPSKRRGHTCTGAAKRQQLKFYADDYPIWKRVLEEAKLEARVLLAIENAWPNWDLASREAKEIISEVVAKFEADNRKPESGKQYICFSLHPFISCCSDLKITPDMIKLVCILSSLCPAANVVVQDCQRCLHIPW